MKNQICQRYGRVAIWPYLHINFYRNELRDVPKMNTIPWHTSTGLFTQYTYNTLLTDGHPICSHHNGEDMTWSATRSSCKALFISFFLAIINYLATNTTLYKLYRERSPWEAKFPFLMRERSCTCKVMLLRIIGSIMSSLCFLSCKKVLL